MELVVGATGVLGGEICRLLAAQGRRVRALVRESSSRERVERLEELGCELAVGDLRQPETLAAACDGVRAVISTATAILSEDTTNSIEAADRDGQLSLVAAAEDAGAEQFVYVSFVGIDVDSPLQQAKRAVEARLRQSRLSHTILRPTNFIEIWLSPAVGFDPGGGRARIYGSGENAISWISYRDVARFAVAALDHDAARNAVVDLGGPAALTPLEVVRLFEQETGRTIAVEHVPEGVLEAQLRGASSSREASFAGAMLGTARGQPVDMTETLRAFPLELRSVRDYAHELLAAQR
jgi:NADH dehydrogenase